MLLTLHEIPKGNDTMNRRNLSLSMFALSFTTLPAIAQDSVEYRFEYVAEWSADTHPTTFPSNPHFSGAIGATHNAQLSIWIPSGIATDGIEAMAETGSPTQLSSEVQHAIDVDGTANQFLNLGGINSSPGTRTNNFIADADFPLLSLVSMVAPSPDWFVGIHDIDLRPDGVWVRELVFDLYPYDAGTDAGINYVNANIDITPHIPIVEITDDFPFLGLGRLGTFRITLMSDASCSLADLAEPYETLDFFDVSAFINAYNDQDPAADLDQNGVFDFFDVSGFVNTYTAGCP